MDSTRRQFLIGSSTTVSFLSGCTRLTGDKVTINQLEVELVNKTDSKQIFHFAVETTEGLDHWQSREVNAETSESVKRDVPDGYDPLAIHGVVDDQTASGDLIGRDGMESEEICYHIVFEYEVGDSPSFLESTDGRCD
ncbi:hypothetical protein ACFOZ7_06625 [Natribaculum luteum]|uniref:Uncharacterized protein n=1 Tax=Natribaculum luteum TaxID=1586232 RepID=A0ABD5NX82_9EURY|nr:hypothetical protein [Natribaculum luteum]